MKARYIALEKGWNGFLIPNDIYDYYSIIERINGKSFGRRYIIYLPNYKFKRISISKYLFKKYFIDIVDERNIKLEKLNEPAS